MSKQVLAKGIFGWDGVERRTSRYGSIHLSGAPFNPTAGSTIVKYDKVLLKRLEGKRVRLTVEVVEVRDSGHVGDAFLKIVPRRPNVGDIVDLGVGELGSLPGWDGEPDIFLAPKDRAKDLWIDPRKLYRLHDQTVIVYVEETADPFSKRPNLRSPVDEGVISNGDGTLQVRTKRDWPKEAASLAIAPQVERIGDGMFLVAPVGSTPKGTRHKLIKRGAP